MKTSISSCTSISVLQWLLNAETSHPTSSPPHRLTRFFTTLHSCLKNPSRAIFQFYPSSDDQIQLITSIAQKAGFGGGIVVDYPNSNKARKVFLCLFVGGGGGQQNLPQALDDGVVDDSKARFEKRRAREKERTRAGPRKKVKDRDWILKKKEVACFAFWVALMLTLVPVIQEARKRQCSTRLQVYWKATETRLLMVAYLILFTRSSGHAATASSGPLRMNKPCRAAILTRWF